MGWRVRGLTVDDRDVEMVRAFVSVNVGPVAREALAAAMQQLTARLPDGAVRWSDPAQLHLTLRFLGNVPSLQVGRLAVALSECLGTQPAFSVAMEGAGCFPGARAPRVVWVGLQPGNGVEALRQLQARVEAAVTGLGFPSSDHPFSPHLTLGRLGQDVRVATARQVGAVVAGWAPPPLGVLEVDAVHLMESRLTPQGAQHTSLHRFALG